MKKVKLFSFALAALMLGACSSEDVIDNGGQPQWNDKVRLYQPCHSAPYAAWYTCQR